MKVEKWLEPIGLVLLLGAFIWQTSAYYHSEISKSEQLYKIETALEYIASSECEEALRDSARYQGPASMWKNYDCMLAFVNSYDSDREQRNLHDDKSIQAWWIQLILYVIGSICVVIGKVYEAKRKEI